MDLKDSNFMLEISKIHDKKMMILNKYIGTSNVKKGIPIKKIPFAGEGKPRK